MKIVRQSSRQLKPLIIAGLANVMLATTLSAGAAEPYSPVMDKAGELAQSMNYASYQTALKVRCNGLPLGESSQQVHAGDSVGEDLFPPESTGLGHCPVGGKLRLYQRVTSFPGASADMALLQVEVFSEQGREQRRMIAPTFGVRLGETQEYLVVTEWGNIQIEALVNGQEPTQDPVENGPVGIAYPGL